MELGQDLLFFFSALGAFNSLLLGSYVLVNSRKYPTAYIFLGGLLLAHAIRAGFSCLYYFDDVPREFIKVGLTAQLLIGPNIYYFLRFRLDKKGQTRWPLFHILGLMATSVILSVLYNFQTWDYTFRYAIHGLLSIYLIVAGFGLFPALKGLVSNTFTIEQKEALLIYGTVLLICLGFVVSLYTNYILGPLWYSILFYGASFFFYKIHQSASVVSSYKNKLDQEDVKKVELRLEKLMSENHVYRDSTLSLEKLAKMLSVSKYFLSQMLNDNLQKPYHELINAYRIEDACALLENANHLTLEAIAYEVGFNSKSSFFAAFKKLKGATPAKFRAGLQV